MSQQDMRKVYLYSKFERFWHWAQAILITVLVVTGLEVHGSYELLGFERATTWHETAGITWVVLYVFIVFWLLTTGQWKQYVPTTKKLLKVVRYYGFGIFRGEPHPVPKRPEAKHNPLQRLTYLGLASALIPFMLVTGLLYWSYNDWTALGLGSLSLGAVAILHLVGAFLILVFYIVHVYMTTTGHSITAHVQAMFTGWEEVRDESNVEDWERRERPGDA